MGVRVKEGGGEKKVYAYQNVIEGYCLYFTWGVYIWGDGGQMPVQHLRKDNANEMRPRYIDFHLGGGNAVV